MKHHIVICSFMLVAWVIPRASAQNIEATYSARIAGITVGQARVSGAVSRSSYRIRIWGTYAVPGIFSGAFDVAAAGAVVSSDRLLPSSYRSSSSYWSPFSGQRNRTISLIFSQENATRITIDPPLTPDEEKDRVPLLDTDRQAVIDPASGLLATVMRVSSRVDGCPGTERVFSGLSHFDLSGSGGRPSEGPAVCAVRFQPVAGHRRTTIGRSANIILPSKEYGVARLPTTIEVRLPVGSIVIERTN
jgi:Protein of unknown function (DUF3108)